MTKKYIIVFSGDDSFHMLRARGSCPGEKPAVGRVCRLILCCVVMTRRGPGELLQWRADLGAENIRVKSDQ